MTEREQHRKKRDEIGEDAFASAFSEEFHRFGYILDHPDEVMQEDRMWNAHELHHLLRIIMDAKVDPSAVLRKATVKWNTDHPDKNAL